MREMQFRLLARFRMTRLFRILALLFWLAAVVCLLSCGWSWAWDVNAWETPYRMAWRYRWDLEMGHRDFNARLIYVYCMLLACSYFKYTSDWHATRRDPSI